MKKNGCISTRAARRRLVAIFAAIVAVALCGAGSAGAAETTSIGTAASSQTVGNAIHDTATLSGATANAGGTITFNVWGPSASPDCSGSPIFTSTVSVSGNGNYLSADFTPSTAGSYYWIASYSGDGNNLPSSGSCGDASETSTVGKKTSLIDTTASSQTIGSAVNDTATLSSATASAGGTITFNLYGPSASPDCSGAPIFTSTVSVNGPGNYGSGNFTPTTAGAYYWIASYSGDVNNLPASGSCGATGETSVLAKKTTGLVTAGTSGTIGDAVHDVATLSGATANSGGTITFNVWGPSASPDCSGSPIFTSTVSVSGNGNYNSSNFTPTTAGSYYWIASYSGDLNNLPSTGLCGDSGETSALGAAAPTLGTAASGGITIGGTVKDTAGLGGGNNPTGLIEFSLFGPGDPTCSGIPVFTGTTSVSGDATYDSPEFLPTEAGTYTWFAEYTGDANNLAIGSCGGAGETVTVAKATPTIASQSSPEIHLGGTITDRATLSAGHAPSGSIVFRAYGPDDATCSGTPAFTSGAVTVSGDGEYTSPAFTPAAAGVYRWIASYSGDANNESAAGSCNDANESVTVAPAETLPTKPAPPAAPIVCTPIEPTVGNYAPGAPSTQASAATPVPGVRARLRVPVPSDQQVAATLRFRWHGKPRTLDLGNRTLSNPGTANLRLALPANWRNRLPVGTKVTLALQITSTPQGSASCVDPTTSGKTLRTRVVRVLGG